MIIIIGAGLSGLLTAYRLKQEGIPFKLLEARERVGGRIDTLYGTTNTPVEMGATWFCSYHMHLIALLEELGIEYFEQYMEGTAFYQPSSTSPAESIQIPSQPPSYRISGGSSHLINTLFRKLDKTDVVLNQTVKEINFNKDSVQVIADKTFIGNKVVLAIPPKLWANKITFTPSLPANLMHIALHTHTWMEDSIKIALTYNQPFWQQENLSGTLFSNSGPITELYDHCNESRSKYALCGFINSSLKHLANAELLALVINQLRTVFGAKAKNFIDYQECIWSEEEYTFTESENMLYPHQNNGNPIFGMSFCDDKMLISSSESASQFPGYMDGAVFSGNGTATRIIKSHRNEVLT